MSPRIRKAVLGIHLLSTFTAAATMCLYLGCGGLNEDDERGVRYATALETCNHEAKTLCESIACENHARAANGRMPRALPTSCASADAGAADSGVDSSRRPDSGFSRIEVPHVLW